jgi:hypothetical protein
MPPGAIAACTHSCGVWLNAEAAREVLEPSELTASRLTTWFRERVPCPHCNKQMTLYGTDMALFQGCNEHGFWVDHETVSQTGLARPASAARLDAARAAAREMRLEEERRKAQEREARAQAERDAYEQSAEARRAREEAEVETRRLEAQRNRLRMPYVKMLQRMREGDILPLADYMLQLEDTVEALKRRVQQLEDDK